MDTAVLSYLATTASWPWHRVRREQQEALGLRTHSGPYIRAVVPDADFPSAGRSRSRSARRRRLFVACAEPPELQDYLRHVGFVLHDDVDECMCCGRDWATASAADSGIAATLLCCALPLKTSCFACGGVFCFRCAPQWATLWRLESCGPLRVCVICCYGQEDVEYVCTAAEALVEEGLDGGEGETSTAALTAAALTAAAEEDALEQRRREQQQQFQQQLLRQASAETVEEVLRLRAAQEASVTRETVTDDGYAYVSLRHLTTDTVAVQSAAAVADDDAVTQYQELARFGPLSRVRPLPQLVLKTRRRDNGEKLFVNICVHDGVPLRAETPTAATDGPVYMLATPPVAFVNPRDGQRCSVADVVVHPKEMRLCVADTTGARRQWLCRQCVAFLRQRFEAPAPAADDGVDDAKLLRVFGNYKAPVGDGDGDGDGGGASAATVTVRELLLPAPDAFFLYERVVAPPLALFASPPPLTSQTSQAETQRSSATSPSAADGADDDAHGAFRDAHWRRLHAVFVSRRERRQFVDAPRGGDTVQEWLDTRRVVLRDALLTPLPAFAISAWDETQCRPLLVDVAHAPQVGVALAAAEEAEREDGEKERETETLPWIVGAAEEREMEGRVVTWLRVVLPSRRVLPALADESGRLREELSVELLRRLSATRLSISDAFALPIAGLDFRDSTAPEDAVLNVTEAQKEQWTLLFVGSLWKQGRGNVKSWRERIVCIGADALHYFDWPRRQLQGVFQLGQVAHCETVSPASCQAPIDTFPFQLRSHAGGGELLNCYTTTATQRRDFLMALAALKATLTVAITVWTTPPPRIGWLYKQGHLVANWKKRFCVLIDGELSYYEHDGLLQGGGREEPKGRVPLANCHIAILRADKYNNLFSTQQYPLQIADDQSNFTLVVRCEDEDDRSSWLDALRRHAALAKEQTKATTSDIVARTRRLDQGIARDFRVLILSNHQRFIR